MDELQSFQQFQGFQSFSDSHEVPLTVISRRSREIFRRDPSRSFGMTASVVVKRS